MTHKEHVEPVKLPEGFITINYYDLFTKLLHVPCGEAVHIGLTQQLSVETLVLLASTHTCATKPPTASSVE